MKGFFKGKELIDALRRQLIVGCDERIARRIARQCCVREFSARTALIAQDDNSTEIYLILRGSVDVFVNGRCIGSRTVGQHVGEMATILKSKRTATVRARDHCIVACLTRMQFHALADTYPKQIWRALAEELADRLDKRRKLIREQNLKPYVFIGSSSQQKDVAEALRHAIEAPDIEVHVWNDPDVFEASDVFIETLTREAERADFAVIIFGKDDVLMKGKNRCFVPRDNVVFEAGLFMGGISRTRTMIVSPKGVTLRILSDINGMTRLAYKKGRRKKPDGRGFETHVDVADASSSIKKRIRKEWVR